MKKINIQEGQALITLLFFVVISTIVTTAAIVLLFENSLSTSRIEEGTNSYYIAESGIENALIQLLRNPSYQGETFSVSDGSTVVQVVEGENNVFTVTSSGTVGNSESTIQATVFYENDQLSITSWREIY